MQSLLYRTDVRINDYITVVIPTVGEIIDSEPEYYGAISMLTSMPIDMMVQLDDIGIDFTTIDEYELFLILFNSLKNMDTKLIFGSLNLSTFRPSVNTQNGEVILVNGEGAVIDREIHNQIASSLRKIHGLEKNVRKPGNKEARDFMIDRARRKQKKRRKAEEESQLEKLIVGLVNTSEFPYNYADVRELSIYQFNQSLWQITHKINYDNIMHGVYAGTVDAKELSQDNLTWLIINKEER